jgi:hypothetical protein
VIAGVVLVVYVVVGAILAVALGVGAWRNSGDSQ